MTTHNYRNVDFTSIRHLRNTLFILTGFRFSNLKLSRNARCRILPSLSQSRSHKRATFVFPQARMKSYYWAHKIVAAQNRYSELFCPFL